MKTLKYPYFEVSYNTGNEAFYEKGVFGDIVFSLTKEITDSKEKLMDKQFPRREDLYF